MPGRRENVSARGAFLLGIGVCGAGIPLLDKDHPIRLLLLAQQIPWKTVQASHSHGSREAVKKAVSQGIHYCILCLDYNSVDLMRWFH
jgi:hypothetical protein